MSDFEPNENWAGNAGSLGRLGHSFASSYPFLQTEIEASPEEAREIHGKEPLAPNPWAEAAQLPSSLRSLEIILPHASCLHFYAM